MSGGHQRLGPTPCNLSAFLELRAETCDGVLSSSKGLQDCIVCGQYRLVRCGDSDEEFFKLRPIGHVQVHVKVKMPGLPPTGGWGTSGRTLGIKMEGFTDEQIAAAVDYCDNDKVKTLKHLAKLKEKNGGYSWKPEVEKLLPGMDSQMRSLCQKLLTYDNVPIKQKTFVNFAKNSLALMRQPQLADKMWDLIGPLLKKPAQEAPSVANKVEMESMEVEHGDDEAAKPNMKKEKSAAAETASSEQEEKKKKKKKKTEGDSDGQELAGVQEASTPDPEAESETQTKKKKKSKLPPQPADEEEDEAAAAESEVKEEKKKKKKKKSKASGDDEEEAAVEPEPAASRKRAVEETAAADAVSGDDDTDRKAKKKDSKKQRREGGEAAAASGGGGGAEKFDFYKEPAAVTAASAADVLKFRTEMTIKVPGPARRGAARRTQTPRLLYAGSRPGARARARALKDEPLSSCRAPHGGGGGV